MATLDSLKSGLRQKARAAADPRTKLLSDTKYDAGFDVLLQGAGWLTYQDFIIPELSRLLVPLFTSRSQVSVLEIGPGPKSVLGHVADDLRRKITRYVAFEPNKLFAASLHKWLCSISETKPPLLCLKCPPDIRQAPFTLDSNGSSSDVERFDVIIFCHSMYGMKPERDYIKLALDMLVPQPERGLLVVFHRDEKLRLNGLVCHRTAKFPTGIVSVADDDKVLDCFASFIAGFVMRDVEVDKTIRAEWRKVCRTLGCREETHPGRLQSSSPNVMVAFTQHATALSELTPHVPMLNSGKMVKNREARLHHPASIVRPTEIRQVEQCVRWALKYQVGLTVIGGGHSGHCLWPNVVAVDMSAFDKLHIIPARDEGGGSSFDATSLVVAESGCTTGDIIRKTLAVGLTVPLVSKQARSSVLAEYQTNTSRRAPYTPKNENDLLWAVKGAGTNFGIVVSVTFKAYRVMTYSIRNWVFPLRKEAEAELKLDHFDRSVASKLPRNCSVDAYLYWNAGQLCLGVTMFECCTTKLALEMYPPTFVQEALGPENSSKVVDGIGLFDADMYMTGMHGGHRSGKTSSFKRSLFLKAIGETQVTAAFVNAVKTRPSPLCYLHLLQGGGAIDDVADDAAAFGCRGWDFACVVTGVWPREQDGTETARAVVKWVYQVAGNLLPLSIGVYSADLGPDPRDAELASRAFGPNGSWPASSADRTQPKLVILVTGESCAGKDHCADVWASVFAGKCLKARVVSISDATKREYAMDTGADLGRLLQDRVYKEQHRPALTAFYEDQVQQRPELPKEHFLQLLSGAADVDVLLITGMRDNAPVATFSYLVPDSRVIEVRVTASEETRRARGGCQGVSDSDNNGNEVEYGPNLIFNNDTDDNETVQVFAEHSLLPFFHQDLPRLASMVRLVPDFPRPGIDFRHVLDIAQQPGGLSLCTSLLQSQFVGDCATVGAIACCEAGGYVFAPGLADKVNKPLVLIRDAGKIPPPKVYAVKPPSHISSLASTNSTEARIELDPDRVPKGASVVVVEDVLATEKTLCAMLELLKKASASTSHVSVMVVAEFPHHRGRDFLRRRGFGLVNVQSLLVFGGA
ncbi:phosphoribosyl transferase domain [Fusarium albosuccineum]|uniref:Phosphoribosyl transferase domain n=1 Tax=Fusarium albosuccineum TaxID=1237068 RepID=A0A8H4P9F1_9HYPO|nr:phosphoribosyl transferase domain [Fusarium albosuccineum]